MEVLVAFSIGGTMTKSIVFLAGLTVLGSGVVSASYIPVGVQLNVPIATVTTGGWTQCYAATYGASGTTIAAAIADCGGNLMMLAAGATGSNTLDVLAWANTTDVMFDTGTGNITHNANGTEWYFNDSWSWGFAPGGETVSRNSCDVNNLASPDRLCWHTTGGAMEGGWRDGANTGLNASTDFTKYIFTATSESSVPEPATSGLIGFGLAAGVIVFRHRRN